MKSFVISLFTSMLVLAVVPVNGLSKSHEPPDAKFMAVEQIVILPAVDARAGKKGRVDLNRWLRKSAQKDLKRKNYSVSLSDSTGDVGEIVEEDLSGPTPQWIKRLGPPDSRWVMVIGINDVHSKTTFGSTGNAEVFGALYDKEAGSVLWNGKGIGQVGQGGLMGMAMKGAMSASAIQIATLNLLHEIPKVPKKRKQHST
jgi:hypothetical protein